MKMEIDLTGIKGLRSTKSTTKINWDISTEGMTAIENISTPLPKGARRDWTETADVILAEIEKDVHENDIQIDIPKAGLDGYLIYLLQMSTTFPTTMKGTGPTINGIKTPQHNGSGYDRLRAGLVEFMADREIIWTGSEWDKGETRVIFNVI